MTVVESPTSPSAESRAQEWLSAFEEAVRLSDAGAAAALFLPDGHWRDILAFSWQLRTYSGADQIKRALAASLPNVRPGGFEVSTTTPPRHVRRAGEDAIEVIFHFETVVGRGRGVVRFLADKPGPPLAWTLFTALEELKGHEEHVGGRRPHGEPFSRNWGGMNWLEERQAAAEYKDRDPVVVVVGAGQAGLSIAARLNQLDVDTLVVDRLERVGDVWRQRYHSLALHNEVWVNHLPYLPFPDTWPVYVPKDKLGNWLEFYAEAMEINVWTGTEFVSGEYDEVQQRWNVTLQRADGTRRVMHPRHVVMATGVTGIPRMPDIPGLDDFSGDVIHTEQYRKGSQYVGKRAIVIGTGTSGHDVAQDLYSFGIPVTMVQRGSTTVVNVEPTAQKVYALYKEGLPQDDADLLLPSLPFPVLKRAYQLLAREMEQDDKELIDGLHSVGFRTDSGPDDAGFHMKFLEYHGGYYLNVGCSNLIIDRKVGLVQYEDMDRIVPDGLRLKDGTTVPADLIVLATGYHTQQTLVRSLFGDEAADRVGKVWGLDEEGELRNMWRRTGQPGLWFHGGSLSQNRVFSRFLALQIKACEVGLIDHTPSPPAVQ